MVKRLAFWTIFASILVATTLAGIELICAVIAPAWPAYLLRPTLITPTKALAAGAFMPEVNFIVNSWHTRDLERTVSKRRDLFDTRAVFVGDSFLEGGFTRAPLTIRIEAMLMDKGVRSVEAVNLGISATDLSEYYYRIREVALKIEPDIVFLSFYSGNDFTSKSFNAHRMPLVAPLPLPSVLGTIMPHTTWIARNVKRPTDDGQDQKLIDRIVEMPPDQRLEQLSEHARRYYAPAASTEQIKEILSRGEDRLWSEARPRRFDREMLPGWVINRVVNWELDRRAALAETPGSDEKVVDSTLSWLEAAQRLVIKDKVKFAVILIPVGVVDPEYSEFWRPWPSYLNYNLRAEARRQLLARRLLEKNIPFIDLKPVLEGIGGTYRKLDGHWTEKGHEVVARFLANEILRRD